jgi:hypothetical protein
VPGNGKKGRESGGRSGMLLGRCEGEPEFRVFLGSVDDLLRNTHGLAPVAELDGDELGYLVARAVEIKRRR